MPEVRCPLLVGRDVELAVLTSAVARGAAGEGAVVFVLGEAGVGKTDWSRPPPPLPARRG
ncbi:MAG TPA: ATP-binding protein [Acidimicrobiales bacterium]|nr:ATP-binding protein [Acidimicrobiales bacterium]